MGLTYKAYYYKENMPFSECMENFYTFTVKAKNISKHFGNLYFKASSLKEFLERKLPEDKEDVFAMIEKYADTGQVLGTTHTYFSLGSYIEGIDGFLDIFMVHMSKGSSTFSFNFVKIPQKEIIAGRPMFDKIIEAFVSSFPVTYITENVLTDGMAWYALKLSIGWSIYASIEDLGRVRKFPCKEIFPGFMRISCVEDVFDVRNPLHVEKTKELEAEITSNSAFVKKVQFVNPHAEKE